MSSSLSDTKNNLLSGLTVALALVPEAIAFAFVAHLHPLVGLYAAFIVCLITAVWGGRPGMISAAAGSLAVVMVDLVVRHGAEYLFATVIVMGVLQILFALFRLGKFIRMVPHPVMLGFVNGLAIVIFLAQFGHFKVRDAAGAAVWMTPHQMAVMAGLIAVTVALVYLIPRVTKAVPSALAAIVLVSLLVAVAGIPAKTVGEMASIRGGFPPFHLPAVPWNLATLWIVLPYAVILSLVGLIESLLTLNLIDEITGTRGRPNRESLALGAANVVAGFFGSMGGCALIGQSMINVTSGATRRLSGITAGLLLLGFVLFASSWIERIPVAALVGVMFVVSAKTFAWASLRIWRKVPHHDYLVMVLVTVVTIFTDLAVAVILGVILSALVFAWEHAKEIRATSRVEADGTKVYELTGTLFFASASRFQELFSPKEDPQEIVIEFRRARVADHSAIEALDSLTAKYEALGKRLHLRHLSPDCRELLTRKGVIETDPAGDPHYRVADDQLA
ncbi:sulfate permease, SulP family [Verrucomicrobium sp. GAS474]|uniref:SulP family inorganic anion transporter n=1 Tax=Verrucomicrobium sp. GAS474 TaxID=1882831 RepID=UPI00087D2B74|nr:SulP family inorganic anion transporter [Verrucomicrobium sp. GAS474]SDT88831.1 sulfate permease, SulP family [Verrucomicrobium sp. GAS474]